MNGKVQFSLQIDGFWSIFGPFWSTNSRGQSCLTVLGSFANYIEFAPVYSIFEPKMFVYFNDDIFGENNHQELLNEDSYRTERGFCGHGRISSRVNSRKIRAILRYFKIFCQFCRNASVCYYITSPLISNLAPFRPKFRFFIRKCAITLGHSKMKKVIFDQFSQDRYF